MSRSLFAFALWTSLFVAIGAGTAACSREEKLVQALCQNDTDCAGGLICENSQCVEASTKACDVVTEGNPILQPTPRAVNFGQLEKEEEVQTFSIRNLGNCTLTLFEANIVGADAKDFGCETCTGNFPIEVFPGRTKNIDIRFKASRIGDFRSDLVLLSDDKEYPEIRVPLQARFIGVPNLRAAPNPVDFGYLAEGRQARQQVQLTNQGSGVAAIVVNALRLEPADTPDFTLAANALPGPVTLRPVVGDFKDIHAFDVQYHPRSTASHAATLVVVTDKGEMRVPVTGNSQTPPTIVVATDTLDLGQVPLGQSRSKVLTILNEGGSNLNVTYSFSGPTPQSTSDLFASPNVIPPIPPGQRADVNIGVFATKLGPIPGFLTLTSNDPAKPSVTVRVNAEGVPGTGNEVVRVEMTFSNGSEGIFDNDLRNVDMTLESPAGHVCNKAYPEPKNWGAYGLPTWLAFPPKEEPERIILAEAAQDGVYRVSVSYIEDCSTLPSGLVAGLLGITVDALITSVSSGAVNINGQDLAKVIAENCTGRSATQVSIKVAVNGQERDERTFNLNKRGDRIPQAFEIVRQNGTFTVR